MKLNLEIEIDFIDDGYNLNETIKNEIIAAIANTVRLSLKESLKRKVSNRISVNLDKWIMEQLHSFCDRRIEITDKWGDTQEHHESVTEMFKSKFDKFFNASVDKDGKEQKGCSYSARTTRIDYMLNQKAEEYMKKLIGDMDRKISNAVSAAQKNEIEKKITEKATEIVKKVITQNNPL